MSQKLKGREIQKLCNGICQRIKLRFKGIRLLPKNIGSFSCNHCELFLPITILDTMYWNDKEIIELVLNHRGKKYGPTGEQILEKLRQNGRFCFCCGMKFSMSHKGSYVADKRDKLELVGLITRQ